MSNDLIAREGATERRDGRADRRRFLKAAGSAGVLGLGALGAGHLSAGSAAAQSVTTDNDVLNFALHLEYLEAEFYLLGVEGRNLNAADTTGTGVLGGVTGGRRVTFDTPVIREYFAEVAADEEKHVQFLRRTLGSAANARPAIDLATSFNTAAAAAGLPTPFDPFENENSFLLASFIFEDVGVTAYRGGGRIIQNRNILNAAAGILAVEAFHASQVRTLLFLRGFGQQVNQISDARDSLDNTGEAGIVADDDQGIRGTGLVGPDGGRNANIAPTDADGLCFARTVRQVLNIVFLNGNSTATSGGFFPNGINLGRA